MSATYSGGLLDQLVHIALRLIILAAIVLSLIHVDSLLAVSIDSTWLLVWLSLHSLGHLLVVALGWLSVLWWRNGLTMLMPFKLDSLQEQFKLSD